MPLPAFLLPLLGSGLQGGASIGGTLLQNRFNKEEADRQRQWNSQQQDKQNTWNLNQWNRENAYNLNMWNNQNRYNESQIQDSRNYNMDMWNLQNKYNSPIEQMARLKEAGLSPHLMYGKGTVGQSGQLTGQPNKAQMPSANNLQSAGIQGYSRAQMQNVLQGLDTFSKYAQLKNLQAQTDNVQAQSDFARQNALLTGQKTLTEALNVKKGTRENRIGDKLEQTTIQGAEANLQMLQQSVREKTAQANVAMSTQNTQIKRAAAELKGIMAANKGKQLENKMRTFEVGLNKLGITKTDDVMLRILIMSAAEGEQSDLYKYMPFISKFLPKGLNFKR